MATRNFILALVTGLALAGPPLFAAPPDAPSVAPASAPGRSSATVLSPAVQAAIADFGAEDYKTRQDAVNKLELALGDQIRDLVASDDPEIQARIISLLQFDEGLTRWVTDTYKLPPDQRKAIIAFGLQPDILPVLALTFSPDAGKRVEAAHQLGKIDKPEATRLLARLLQDEDRAVYLAAMEAVWDRKPTDAIVDALWDRAVAAAINMYEGRFNSYSVAEQNLKFRGRPLPAINFYDNSAQRRMQDGDIATDVLIHFKAPQVAAKVKAFLEDYARVSTSNGRNGSIWNYSANSPPMRDAFRMIAAYKSRDTLDILYKIATSPMQQPSQGVFNGEKFFWSNRTTALAALIEALDLKPDDYKLKRSPFMGGAWTSSTEADENDAIKQIQKYWAAHAATLGPVNTSAATQPAGAATEPAESPAQNRPHIMIQPGAFKPLQIHRALPPPATQK